MSNKERTATPWHAEYFIDLDQWDVTHGPADDARERYSVLENLSEADAKFIADAPADLARKNAALVLAGEVLTESEWDGVSYYGYVNCCPYCGGARDKTDSRPRPTNGHATDCRLMAARRAVEEALKG